MKSQIQIHRIGGLCDPWGFSYRGESKQAQEILDGKSYPLSGIALFKHRKKYPYENSFLRKGLQ